MGCRNGSDSPACQEILGLNGGRIKFGLHIRIAEMMLITGGGRDPGWEIAHHAHHIAMQKYY